MSTDEGADRRDCPASTDGSVGFLEWALSGRRVGFATDDRGRLTWWNDHLEAVTARDPEGLEGTPAVELFAGDPAEIGRRLSGVLEGTGRERLPVETADDGTAPYEFDGTVRAGPNGGACLYAGAPSARKWSDEGSTTAADRREGASESDRHRRIVETIRDGVFTLDGDWRLVDVNRPLASMLGRDRAALVGTHAAELIAPDGSVERARAAWRALQEGEVESGSVRLTMRRGDGEQFRAEVRYGRVALGDGDVGAVGVVRDVTEREARAARLREHRDRLARLNRIGEAAAAALDPVLEAGSRDAIERRVCERLRDTDLYDVVWIGRPAGGDSLAPRTTAGADERFHEVAERLTERTDHERSADLAFRRGEPVVNRDGWDAEAGEVVREATGGRELRATMAVPVEYQGTTYGALTAYSTREGAFFEAEREALCRLGRAVGFAIGAVGTRRLVHAHERAELEFRVGTESSVLAAISAAVDAQCVLRWTTPATGPDGERERAASSRSEASPHDLWLRVAVEGTGIDAEAVLDAAEGTGVVETRVVEAGTDGSTVDLRAPESVPGYVVDAGARPREVVADGGRARVVAEAPAGADIRSVVESFTDATGGRLVAKRAAGGGPESAGDELTEKQREALRTAESMGYFDWPREHTAEEVADRLGVASATLHYHLRAAQRTLVREALDGASEE